MTLEPTNPKPRRRWRQFSLRTFFVLLTVLCVWLGWTVHRANEQRKAVEEVQKMGAMVFYDYEVDEDNINMNMHDGSRPGPDWLWDFLGPDLLDEVVGVKTHSPEVSDLTPLAALTSLRRLDLSYTHVSDLTPLMGLQKIEILYLSFTDVADVTALTKLTSLKILDLDRTPVSEEQVKALRQALPNCRITWTPRTSDESP